jgi:hypothetical protein
MEGDEARQSKVELKYCERCGALWLRPRSGLGRYGNEL